MNGNWYPWSDGVNGNASGSYVQAWKHVHDLVVAQSHEREVGVEPERAVPGSTDLASLYPGADQVDVVALDGYNWAPSPASAGPRRPTSSVPASRSCAPSRPGSRSSSARSPRARRADQGRVGHGPGRVPPGPARRARLRVVRLPEGGGLAHRQLRRLRHRPPRGARPPAGLIPCDRAAHSRRPAGAWASRGERGLRSDLRPSDPTAAHAMRRRW